jgi:hypothetical protein
MAKIVQHRLKARAIFSIEPLQERSAEKLFPGVPPNLFPGAVEGENVSGQV